MRKVTGLVLVYNGDSGVTAMLLDAVKKAMGQEDCALCEVVYSPIGKRSTWKACQARLGVPVEEMHRDNIPAAWLNARDALPCVLGKHASDAVPTVLLNRAQITACKGSVEELEEALRAAMEPSAAGVEQSPN